MNHDMSPEAAMIQIMTECHLVDGTLLSPMPDLVSEPHDEMDILRPIKESGEEMAAEYSVDNEMNALDDEKERSSSTRGRGEKISRAFTKALENKDATQRAGQKEDVELDLDSTESSKSLRMAADICVDDVLTTLDAKQISSPRRDENPTQSGEEETEHELEMKRDSIGMNNLSRMAPEYLEGDVLTDANEVAHKFPERKSTSSMGIQVDKAGILSHDRVEKELVFGSGDEESGEETLAVSLGLHSTSQHKSNDETLDGKRHNTRIKPLLKNEHRWHGEKFAHKELRQGALNSGLRTVDAVKAACFVFGGTKKVELKEPVNGLGTSSEGSAHVEKQKICSPPNKTIEEVVDTPYSTFKEVKENSKAFSRQKKLMKVGTKLLSKGSLQMPQKFAKDNIVLVQKDVEVISSRQYAKTGCDEPPNSGSLPSLSTHDVSPIPASAIPNVCLIPQEWVCCDRCEKWRLLPPGLGSAQLPEEWTCKLLYWLPGMNKCKVPEEVTTQAVEPDYDLAHSEQISRVNCPQVNPFKTEPSSTNNGIERQGTKLIDKKKPISGKKREVPLTVSNNVSALHEEMRTKEVLAKRKKTREKANNGPIQMKTSKESLNGSERNKENFKVKETKEFTCSQANDDLAQKKHGHSLAGVALSEAAGLKQQAIRLQGDGPIEGEVSNTYMRAGLRFLQAAVLMESAQTGNKELLLDIYTNAAGLFKLCAAAYEHSSELAAAVLAYKCMGAAKMWLVHAKSSCVLRDVDKLQSLEKQNPSGSSTIEGNLVISDLCPSYEQVMQYVDDTNAAMESLRRAHFLFMAIKETCTDPSLGASLGVENLVALKSALDFDLHYVGGLVQLVIEAMEVIRH